MKKNIQEIKGNCPICNLEKSKHSIEEAINCSLKIIGADKVKLK